MFIPPGCLPFSHALALIVGENAETELQLTEGERFIEALYVGRVRAKLLITDTGHLAPLDKRFWATPKSEFAKLGLEFPHYFEPHTLAARAFVLREDAERWAADRAPFVAAWKDAHPASRDAGDRAVKAPAKRSLGLAFKAAREFVLLPENDGRKVKQDEARSYVVSKGHYVADDAPGEWWREFKDDPETSGRIAGRGRPPKNPAENPGKKSRR